MSFLYPMGLLGLIGIPVIILIYILLSKYTEQTVTSNYLWHMSDKFMKRKRTFNGMTGLISLLLQLLTVAVISLAIAHPIITLPNAAHRYCFVLDSTSSMHTVEGEDAESRFELAKDAIIDVIKESKGGSSYSLVCVSGETVRVFDDVTSKDTAISLVESTEPTQTTASHVELLGAAQEIFDRDSAAEIYFVTDKGYEKHENIHVIDVGSEDAVNYALSDVTYSHSGGKLSVDASVISHTKDADVEVKLLVDDKEAATSTVSAKKGKATPLSFGVTCDKFSSFTVEIVSPDSYALDNSVVTYNLKSDKTYSTLIVSDTGFFFKAVIDALVDSEIKIVSPEAYESETEEYGLYIFDSYTPSELPDATVWLVNLSESVPDSGFSVRGKTELDKADVIDKSTSTSTSVRHLLRGVGDGDIYITNSVRYSGMYLDFRSLYTYDSHPLIFTGVNGLGNRQVVIGFDLHESDIALASDFVILMRNLVEYSFPDVLDETSYTVGDVALVNIVANAENLKATSPSGKDVFLESDGTTALLTLEEVGTYTVSMTLTGVENTYRIYSAAHPDESVPAVKGEDFSLAGERTYENIDGEYDPIVVLFIALAVLFLADWGVYCYEKYQLR